MSGVGMGSYSPQQQLGNAPSKIQANELPKDYVGKIELDVHSLLLYSLYE